MIQVERVDSSAVPGACANCGQPLTGRFCSRCGEEVLDPHALTVRHFISHAVVHETLHFDGKIWRTLRKLLFRPGLLSAEYCAGRRRISVSPVQLLITAIVVYALLSRGGLLVSLQIGRVALSIAPTKVAEGASVADTIERVDRFGILKSRLAAKEKSKDLGSEAVRERFHSRLERFAEPLSFTNVVLLALALYALFHTTRRLFVEHAVFSLHFLSFVLFSSLAHLPVLWLLDVSEAVGLTFLFGIVIWQFVYLAVGIRRFYFGESPRPIRSGLVATAAALLVYLLNSAFITGVQLIGGMLALLSE